MVCMLGSALAALISGCGTSDPATPGGGAGSAGAAAVDLMGDATRGAAVYSSTTATCNTCHGKMGEGDQGPNISGSVTAGIGSWTQTQFHDAVRLAKGKDGKRLCSFMAAFEEKYISEQGIADVYAFLKSKPSDIVVKGTLKGGANCP